jgi:hypothetical protein
MDIFKILLGLFTIKVYDPSLTSLSIFSLCLYNLDINVLLDDNKKISIDDDFTICNKCNNKYYKYIIHNCRHSQQTHL